MQVAGVIAEYNPFHNGHKYQLEQIRKKTGAQYIIAAMSGNFLQRGGPAIADKYTRAWFALSQGADLVLEIPVLWSTASAEYYATAGVTLLHSTGVVSHLCFGAETDQLPLFETVADYLNDENDNYKQKFHHNLKYLMHFPKARAHTLAECLSPSVSEPDIHKLLASPNNILALEYIRALKKIPSAMTPCLIKRVGDNYHDGQFRSSHASATAIRQKLLSDIQSIELTRVLPAGILQKLISFNSQYGLTTEDSLSQMLGYQLFCTAPARFENFADCNREISNRIYQNLKYYRNFTQFCQLLKTRDVTYTRISRILTHILLQITNEDYKAGKSLQMIPYLRVLGFRKSSSGLLHKIKDNAPVPLITKAADAHKRIAPDAFWMFEKDIFASDIYNQILLTPQNSKQNPAPNPRQKEVPRNDYSRELVIL